MENEDYNLDFGFYKEINICDLLTDDQMDSIGSSLKEQVERDINSRKEWLTRNDKWMELVTQVIENKSYPWPNASNIKFPLISTAAVQFHARAFPALLGNNKPVKAKVIGKDPNGIKAARSTRVSTLMSYQITEDIPNWMDDMDRLLFIVPIIGSLYKKTYYSETKKKIVSELIHPRDLIINYDAVDIENARKTHRIWKLPNSIIESQNRGLYRRFDGDDVYQPSKTSSVPRDKTQGLNNPGVQDDFSLQEFYEVHCLWDLDDDGYKEPYIATIRGEDGKLFRLTANYDDSTIEFDEDGSVIAIEEKDYFTHYFFLPDPESKTHGIGFGTMVGPINESVNTIINQLTDAGHMHTLGGGFLSRGIRMKGGAVAFKPNEWKTINTTGDDLRKGIVPLPTKEPSMVLFQLLGLLIDSGKDLSSVQDIMVGRNPGQNQPYSTSREVISQGLKVFNGIYKRLYRSMTKEFKKIYKLNGEHPDLETYINVLDMNGQDVQEAMKAPDAITGEPRGEEKVLEFLAADFNASDIDVIPTAEPDMVAEMEKISKSNALIEKLAGGMPLNVAEVTKRVLEAEGHEDVATLMNVPPPQPNPEHQLKVQEFEHKQRVDHLQLRLQSMVESSQIKLNNMEAQLALAKAMNEDVKGLHSQFMAEKAQDEAEFNAVTKRLKVLLDGRKNDKAGETVSGDTGSSQQS